jgi:hypothetical protein
MSTYHFLLVLVALGLLVLGALTVASVLDVVKVTNSTQISGIGSSSPATIIQDGEVHATPIASVDSRQLSEGTPQPSVFVEIKGPNGIRAITCAIPSSIM